MHRETYQLVVQQDEIRQQALNFSLDHRKAVEPHHYCYDGTDKEGLGDQTLLQRKHNNDLGNSNSEFNNNCYIL